MFMHVSYCPFSWTVRLLSNISNDFHLQTTNPFPIPGAILGSKTSKRFKAENEKK